MNETNDELNQREEVRRLAEEFAEHLRRVGQPDMEDFVRRIDSSLQGVLREELVGEEFAHRFGDATQAGRLRYLPVEHLGKGAFAEVYKALDEQLSRYVAIKVLLRTEDAAKQQFLSEARRQANLRKHAHLVAVFDSGALPKGNPFAVMEYVGGGTLRKKLDSEGRFRRPIQYLRSPKTTDTNFG